MAAKPTNVYDALFAAQKDMPDLQKNAINPHFKNSYITLDSLMEQVLPVLRKHQIMLIQAPNNIAGGIPSLRTSLHYEGSSITSEMPLTLDRENPQGQGSAITYARRYALMSILGLVADEDDDGNHASPKPKATRKAKAEQESDSEGDIEL